MDSTTQAVSPLRQRMLDDMRMRKFSLKIQSQYIRTARQFAASLAVRFNNNITDRFIIAMVLVQRLAGGNHGGKDETCGTCIDGGSKDDAEGTVEVENSAGARD